jgi:hypothetical protein
MIMIECIDILRRLGYRGAGRVTMTTRIGQEMDTFDILAKIERYEVLEQTKERDADQEDEFKALTVLFDEVAGDGDDERWYSLEFINKDDFLEYAMELTDQC